MSTTPTEILETTIAATESLVTEATEAAIDIESIKALMDGFEPAALLPELSDIFGTLPALCRFCVMLGPVVLLVLGLAYLFLSPKEANWYFGYRCYYGMGSVYAWRFTQRFAGLVLGGTGLAMTVAFFLLSAGFGSMEVTEMVWTAASFLLWEAGIALAANLTINLTAALRFDRKGRHRSKKKA